MRFQDRDGQILEVVHSYDGVLARRQLKSMFWPDASVKAMERRISLLKRNGYLDWPNRKQRRMRPIPEPIVWLGWAGAQYVAGQMGIEVDPPTAPGENQLRTLQRTLRERGIRWLREPRWIQLVHDLAIVDFRLAIERSAAIIPTLTLEEWVSEGEFRSSMDTVEYRITDRDGKVRTEKRGVRPDGFFVISDDTRRRKGEKHKARMLLELDFSTHPLKRIAERAVLYATYITSPQYKARFGYKSGRWLFVTTSEVRLKHLKQHTENAVGKRAFFFWFTTRDKIEGNNLLTDPIWLRGDWKYPGTLFSPEYS